MSNSPAREENEAKAVVGIWDGQCRGSIVEEGEKKNGGAEKRRGYPMRARRWVSRQSLRIPPRWGLLRVAVCAGAQGAKNEAG